MDELNNFDELWKEPLTMIATIISLPDKEFNTISPIVLEEFRKALYTEQHQKEMATILATQGITAEDIAKESDGLYDRIGIELEGYSDDKKEFVKQFFLAIYNSITDSIGKDKRVIQIPIELCNPDAKIPTYAHEGDAGMDVYSTIDITINPGETVLIPLGFKVAIPVGYELQVRPRSGFSLRTHLRVANAPGTIDSGYRDEVGVILTNCAPTIKDFGDGTADTCEYGPSYSISKGDRIAQMVLQEVPSALFVETPDISKIGTDRNGGFGSTGA